MRPVRIHATRNDIFSPLSLPCSGPTVPGQKIPFLILPSSLLLLPFPGQPREPEEIKFPLHSRSGWKERTCIDSGSLGSRCSAAKDVGEMAELPWADAFPSLFLGETHEWDSKTKWWAPVAVAVPLFPSHGSLTAVPHACLCNTPVGIYTVV